VINNRYKWTRYLAIIISLAWVAWWLYNGISGMFLAPDTVEGPSFFQALFRLIPGTIFLITFLISLKWELIGGVILVLIGFANLDFRYIVPSAIFEAILIGAAPPLIAGVLFIIHWFANRKARISAK
jgi:hypothetical protein